MITIKGTGASRGIAIAPFKKLTDNLSKAVRYTVSDSKKEIHRFETARKKAIEDLNSLYQEKLPSLGDEAEIFNIHAMMLDDPDYYESIENKISAELVNAEYAVEDVSEQFAQRFSSMDDDYMKERASDVKDLSHRLISILSSGNYSISSAENSFIIGSMDLMPSQTVQLDKNHVSAFVTGHGSKMSHAAILSRALGIPSVVGLGNSILDIADGTTVIVDGTSGDVVIEPDDYTINEFRKKQNNDKTCTERIKKTVSAVASAAGGKKPEICANIGQPSDADDAIKYGADGIGLFRSEFLYLGKDRFPTEDEQFSAYKSVLEKMGRKRVVIRTIDIGADKRADYFEMPAEENPALGCRAIRLCLQRPDVFRTQLRALMRASAFGRLAIMLPMIISVDEVKAAKAMINEEYVKLADTGKPVGKYELGIMVETPAAALCSDSLAREVDFFSIGTNDLTQYTLAVDRMNNGVSDKFDVHHPAVLLLIKKAADAAHKYGKWVGICGEAAADISLTETWLKYGIDELSMSAGFIPEIRGLF